MLRKTAQPECFTQRSPVIMVSITLNRKHALTSSFFPPELSWCSNQMQSLPFSWWRAAVYEFKTEEVWKVIFMCSKSKLQCRLWSHFIRHLQKNVRYNGSHSWNTSRTKLCV